MTLFIIDPLTHAESLVGIAIAGLAAWAAFSGPKKAAELTTAKLEGTIVTRLDGHDKAIGKIEEEQTRQWQEIGKVGKQVERIEGTMERRARARGANG